MQSLHTIHGADPQLHAAANNADRANKPGALLLLSLTVCVALVAWLIVSAFNLSNAREEYSSERRRQALVVDQANRINELESKTPSLASLYGSSSAPLLMPNHFRRVARDVWELDESTALEPIVQIPSQLQQAQLNSASGIDRADLTISITNQPIERVLQFIDAALNDEFLSSTFLFEIRLTPRVPNGWAASLTFRRYYAQAQ